MDYLNDYKYFALKCVCSIEIRPLKDCLHPVLETKCVCPKCKEHVSIEYYKNVLTPGFSDYEGEYLYEGVKEARSND